MWSFVSDADEVTSRLSSELLFVDAGANWESTNCPNCNRQLDMNWVFEAIDAAYETRFTVLDVRMPCCGARSSLNDLRFDWPCGFARFVLQARNPGVADLTAAQIGKLEDVLGCALRLIWAHY